MAFEAPIADLEEKIESLKALSEQGEMNLTDEIANIESRAHELKKDIYSNLSPADIIQIARHPDRPNSLFLANTIFDQFLELHGDRLYKDDPSIVSGVATMGKQRLVFIGHQKGSNTKENLYRNFGMPHPEGYRKALRMMRLADKFSLPIVSFIDTPGAYPGLEAEQRGQAEAIATNLKYMVTVSVPIVSFVIGEGGSGGALGIGVANRLYMLQHAVYSVISPEGCASILFKDASKAPFAAENLKITAKDIVELGIADGILDEPLGGAHYDPEAMAQTIKSTIERDLNTLGKQSPESLKTERYTKFRQFGAFE
ncbi:MAG: acetyl-CoA carboxylase carboxyltransferase subunit alpha [bacterium]|jgi:acetyl-CoA carboxylase carboxyl transferase subunit alpha|nr:acetyl-CoA carboxylase carboxyltransferase subunit alpha [bacterium]